MTSSIEPEFNPPEHLSRDEVIQMARHYINYWKIEAASGEYHRLESIKLNESNAILTNGLAQMRKANEALWKHFEALEKANTTK